MTPQDLIAAFEVLADAPDGVKRLRELVLQLAVRGKLVPQDPVDEPAAHAVARIGRQRDVLVAQRILRPTKPSDSERIALEQMPLPPGWEFALPDELTALERYALAIGPFGSSLVRSDYCDAGVPLVFVREVTSEMFGGANTKYITASKAQELRAHTVDPGDLLLTKMGAPPGDTAIYPPGRSTAVITADCIKFRIHPELGITEFFKYLYRAPRIRVAIQDITMGIAHQKMSLKRFRSTPIPVAPLAEQQRIVARVDELMGLLDRLEAARNARDEVRRAARDAALAALRDAEDADALDLAWSRLARNMDDLFTSPEDVAQLRQMILQLAVRGRLVPQDAGDAPVAQFLASIGTYAASLGAKPYVGTAAPQWSLPSSWRWVPFGSTHANRDSERVPLSKEVRATRHGEYDYYGASGVIDSLDDFLFDKTLLLLGEDGANLALRSTPVAFLATGRYWVNNHAHVLDSPFEVALRYLAVFINAIDLQPYLTGTAQPKLNQARMNAIPCAVPPLAEQERIVAKVDALISLCDGLEARLASATETHAQFAAAAVHHLDV